MSQQDVPIYAQDVQYRIPVNTYPSTQTPIPPSRMFEIKNALDKYLAKAGAGAPVYDASQGDGGASLPGVPADILMRAAELQVKHGTGYDQPFNAALSRCGTAVSFERRACSSIGLNA